jgi:WD40 repeat protein
MLTIQCPACRRVLHTPAELCGGDVCCPACNHTWALPTMPEAVPAGAGRPTGVVTAPAVVGTRGDIPPAVADLSPRKGDAARPAWLSAVLPVALLVPVALVVAGVGFLVAHRPATPATRPPLATPPSPPPPIPTVAFSPDGTAVVVGSPDGVLVFWDVPAARGARPTGSLRAHTLAVRGVAWAPDGRAVASGGQQDGTIRIWDVATHEQLAALEGHVHAVGCLRFSPDSKSLAAASGPDFWVWDLAAGRGQSWDAGHSTNVTALAYSPDGTTLATAAADGSVATWDARTGQERLRLGGRSGRVYALCFSPDGKVLASGDGNGEARLWDLDAGALHAVVGKRGGPAVLAVAFSPDGATLGAVGTAGVAWVWDAQTGAELGTSNAVPQRGGPILAVAIAPDGKRWAARERDGFMTFKDLPVPVR